MSAQICESTITFDLPDGSYHYGEREGEVETGIDLVIHGNPTIWMEVKNWTPGDLTESRRQMSAGQSVSDTDVEALLWGKLRGKFEKTHDRLSQRDEVPDSLTLLVLLESSAFNAGNLVTFGSLVESEFANSSVLAGIPVAVTNLTNFNVVVSSSSASPCPVTADSKQCLNPVAHCTIQLKTRKRQTP